MHPAAEAPDPPVTTPPAGTPGAGPGVGATRMSRAYYDEKGVRRQARRPVPVDQYGRVTAVDYRCPGCKAEKWFPLAVAARGIPVCEVDNRQMVRREVQAPPLLPWPAIWRVLDRPLRAVWVGAGVGVAGVALDSVVVPGYVLAAVALPAGVAGYRLAGWWLTRRAVDRRYADLVKSGRSSEEALAAVKARGDDGALVEVGRRERATIARRARLVGYDVAAGCLWAALAVVAGTDTRTVGGLVSWALLAAAWFYPAAIWWRYVRQERGRPAPDPEPTVEVEGPPPLDPDEAQTRRVWSTILAATKGKPIARNAEGQEILALRSGKLVGTRLEDWHRVSGGWGATIVSHPGDYTADLFVAARGAIASAFRMKASMITIIPDVDDETRALVLAQRSSPIADVVRWPGPDSIDAEAGQAPMARYADGGFAMYEIYRPGWGSPHDFLCGTTGAGKSETLSTLLLIDRWASYVDAAGTRRGMVADLLIDPQQGQSYEPFMDDLAAPVATNIEEAMLMVGAFRQEMLRRNAYLSKRGWRDPATGVVHRPEWTDERGRTRYGRKWWNPLVDGPILALNIDEAHEFLAFKEFAKLVTAGARMYRKCGMRIRVATHTPLLADLGGSMALRSMLTGGFVWVGRTADSLSGPIAFNGRLPVDPRTIPDVPGTGFVLSRLAPKPMLARTMWEPDYYDWVRNAANEPIGYPAALPPETLSAFGPEFARWAATVRAGDEWVPAAPVGAVAVEPPSQSVNCVRLVLAAASEPMDMDALDAALRESGNGFSTRTIRDALKKLREAGDVLSDGGRHELTPEAYRTVVGQIADTLEVAA